MASTKQRRAPDLWAPYALRVSAAIGWRFLIVMACLYVLLQILASTTEVLIPVLVALLLTALLEPLAKVLRRGLRLPPYAAAGLTLLAFLAVVAGMLTLVASQLTSGLGDLSTEAGSTLASVEHWLRTSPLHLDTSRLTALTGKAQEWLSAHQSELASGALTVGGSALQLATGMVIALVSVLFFLADGGHIWGWVVRLFPERAGHPLNEAMRRAWVSAGAYARTQVVVAVCDAVGIGIGALVLGLPLVIPIAVLVVICAFIPIVGAVLSGGVAVLIALIVKGPTMAVVMLLIVVVVQQVEAHVMGPLLMSRAVELHPWAVIVGVALGSYVAGLVGALFTVPAMAMLNVAVLYLRGDDKFPELGTDDAVFNEDATATADREIGGTPADPDAAAAQRESHHDPDTGSDTLTLG